MNNNKDGLKDNHMDGSKTVYSYIDEDKKKLVLRCVQSEGEPITDWSEFSKKLESKTIKKIQKYLLKHLKHFQNVTFDFDLIEQDFFETDVMVRFSCSKELSIGIFIGCVVKTITK